MLFKWFFSFVIVIWFCKIDNTICDDNIRESLYPINKLTNSFLNSVAPNDNLMYIYNNIYQNIINNTIVDFLKNNYSVVMHRYVGYSILICIGVAFIIFFSLIALICCCKACCHKNRPSVSKSNVKKKRIILNIILFMIVCLIIIGTIIGILSSSTLFLYFKPQNETTESNIYKSLNKTFISLNGFLSQLSRNIISSGHLTYQNMTISYLNMIRNISQMYVDTIRNRLKLNSLLNSSELLFNQLQKLENTSESLAETSSRHQSLTKVWPDQLKNFTNQFEIVLNKTCLSNENDCKNLKRYLPIISNYNMSNINYTHDQNIRNITVNVSLAKFNETLNDLKALSSEFNKNLINLLNNVTEKFNSTLDNLNISQAIESASQNVNGTLFNISDLLRNLTNNLSLNQKDVYKYFQYGNYFLSALGGLILLICLFFLLGLAFGVCGGPSFEDPSYCTKQRGGSMMMVSLSLSVIFSALIMLVVMIMFLVGGLAHTEACRYISGNPSTEREAELSLLIKTVTQNVTIPIGNTKFTLPDLKYSFVSKECAKNQSILKAFDIDPSEINQFTDIVYNQFLKSVVDKLITQITDIHLPEINSDKSKSSIKEIDDILNLLNTASDRTTMTELAKPPSSIIDTKSFQLNINQTVELWTARNETDAVNNLQTVSNEFLQILTNITLSARAYNTSKLEMWTIVDNSKQQSRNIKEGFDALQSNIKQAHGEANNQVANELRSQPKFILSGGVAQFIENLGGCQNLSVAVVTTVDIVCVEIFGHFNDIWMSYGWYLLFITVALCLAMSLRSTYRISHVESSNVNYNRAYMPSNEFLKLSRPEKA